MQQDEIKVGQCWVRNWDGRTARVLAIVEGYCMVRIRGGMPFVIPPDKLQRDYKLNPMKKKTQKQ